LVASSRAWRVAGIVGLALFGFGCVAAAELLLRLAGIASDPPSRDPFAGFSTIVPVFEPASAPDGTPLWRLSEVRRPAGAERGISFRVEKPARGFRVFVVGESTAAGVPYLPELAFGGWLERGLREALPGLEIEVVNVALSGYASRRVLPVVREVIRHEPDLLVIYMGHNEFAERRYFARYADLDPRLFRLWELAATTRLYRLLGRLLPEDPSLRDPEARLRALRDGAGLEMFAVLSGGDLVDADAFAREADVRDALWEVRLREMVRLVGEVGGRSALLGLVQNYSDWAPGASSHRSDLEPGERERWERLREQAARATSAPAALSAYRAALAIDDSHAGLHYELARTYHALGELAAARRHYRAASDLDRVPHGAPTHYDARLRQIARETGSLFVDVDAAFARASGAQLVGDDLFVDFVHPTLAGHQLIARTLLDELRRAGVPRPAEAWRSGLPGWPAADSLRDAALRRRELTLQIAVCRLARRATCLERAARGLLDLDPQDGLARAALEAVAELRSGRGGGGRRRGAQGRAPSSPAGARTRKRSWGPASRVQGRPGCRKA
jgi:lysophospholipase L1-like esterase